jgi:hypothetical protein
MFDYSNTTKRKKFDFLAGTPFGAIALAQLWQDLGTATAQHAVW